jgi:hypothetical protein
MQKKHIEFLNHFPLKSHTNTNIFPHYFLLPNVITHPCPRKSSIPTTHYKSLEIHRNLPKPPLISSTKPHKAHIDPMKIRPLF